MDFTEAYVKNHSEEVPVIDTPAGKPFPLNYMEYSAKDAHEWASKAPFQGRFGYKSRLTSFELLLIPIQLSKTLSIMDGASVLHLTMMRMAPRIAMIGLPMPHATSGRASMTRAP